MSKTLSKFVSMGQVFSGDEELTPEGDILYHFWMGPNPLYGAPEEDIPCYKFNPSKEQAEVFRVTIVKDTVNCKDCLEWMHA